MEPGHDMGTLVDGNVVCDECGDVAHPFPGLGGYVGGMVNGRAIDNPEGPINRFWPFTQPDGEATP